MCLQTATFGNGYRCLKMGWVTFSNENTPQKTTLITTKSSRSHSSSSSSSGIAVLLCSCHSVSQQSSMQQSAMKTHSVWLMMLWRVVVEFTWRGTEWQRPRPLPGASPTLVSSPLFTYTHTYMSTVEHAVSDHVINMLTPNRPSARRAGRHGRPPHTTAVPTPTAISTAAPRASCSQADLTARTRATASRRRDAAAAPCAQSIDASLKSLVIRTLYVAQTALFTWMFTWSDTGQEWMLDLILVTQSVMLIVCWLH